MIFVIYHIDFSTFETFLFFILSQESQQEKSPANKHFLVLRVS